MIIETLQQCGLSQNEAKVYCALLLLGEACVGEITKKISIHERNVYDAVRRLVDKGLIFFILGQGEMIYASVDPGKLSELIEEKENALAEIMPELKKRLLEKKGRSEAYIYRDIDGFKQFFRDFLRIGKNMRTIGAKLSWFDPVVRPFTEHAIKEARKKKMRFTVICDAEVKEKAMKELKSLYGAYRFLPKEYSSESAINIFGDYVVTFSGASILKLEKDLTIFLIRDAEVAAHYREWFNFMWESCATSKR